MNPRTHRPKVLVFVDYYLPGYKAGGPVFSVSRLIQKHHTEFEFAIFTRDRDLGDHHAYTNLRADVWIEGDCAKLFYASPKRQNFFGVYKAIREIQPEIIYLNSYFSKLTRASLFLRYLGLAREAIFVLAPRGEFSHAALSLKGWKKRLYLTIAAKMQLHKNVIWQVSSPYELRDLQSVIPESVNSYFISPDIVDVPSKSVVKPNKEPGKVRFVFLSRISPMKNLLGALKMLHSLEGDITFTIYGPIENAVYWSKCRKEITRLPKNVHVEVAGAVKPDLVKEKLSSEHFFLFPTLGENFGHVIPEALSAGCPVILSDRTPWSDIQRKESGWIISLEDLKSWRELLQRLVNMDGETYKRYSSNARDYIEKLTLSQHQEDFYQSLFSVIRGKSTKEEI